MFILSILPLDRRLVALIEKQTERMRELATSGKRASSTVNKVLLRKYVSVFYVLLTVHLGSVLVNNQLDAQFLFLFMFIPIL